MNRAAKPIRVEEKQIGPGCPVFVIAELGYNFNSIDEALSAVDAAAAAGVDAIKVQTFRAETLVARGFDFPAEAGGSDQFAEFARYEISEEHHRLFFERARQKGLVPLSTPSHYDDVALLERVGIAIYKIGSDDLTNLPFIEHIARKGKPVIFSSGMGSMDEVEEALRVIRRAGNEKAVLLQCTSNYPIKDPALVNLRVMRAFAEKFGVLVGYSDHTQSAYSAAAAAALGACVWERHFTLDKNNGTPDAYFSADPKEMAELVKSLRETEKMLGDGQKRPTETETRMRQYTRKGLIAKRALPKGTRLKESDIVIKRPAIGIAPKELGRVLGRALTRDVKADEPLTWDML